MSTQAFYTSLSPPDFYALRPRVRARDRRPVEARRAGQRGPTPLDLLLDSLYTILKLMRLAYKDGENGSPSSSSTSARRLLRARRAPRRIAGFDRSGSTGALKLRVGCVRRRTRPLCSGDAHVGQMSHVRAPPRRVESPSYGPAPITPLLKDRPGSSSNPPGWGP